MKKTSAVLGIVFGVLSTLFFLVMSVAMVLQEAGSGAIIGMFTTVLSVLTVVNSFLLASELGDN